MNNRKVAEKLTAHPLNQQFATMSQEVNRIMLNCDLSQPHQTRMEIIEEYTAKLVTSGFERPMIARVVRNGIISYKRALAKHNLNLEDLHNPATQGLHRRRLLKIVNKSEWGR